MSTDPRAALDRLIGALETFHNAAVASEDPEADSVLEASDALADAYAVYDDVIFTEYGVESPLDIYGDDDSDEDEEDDDYDLFDDGDDDEDVLDDDVDLDEDDDEEDDDDSDEDGEDGEN